MGHPLNKKIKNKQALPKLGLERALYCGQKLNAQATIQILTKAGSQEAAEATLADHKKELLNRNWTIVVHHCYRKSNASTDWLANLGGRCHAKFVSWIMR